MKTVDRKYEALREYLEKLGSLAIAFSGGVDSSFLLKVAVDILGDKAVAVTSSSETYPSQQLKEAQQVAGEIGARHVVVETTELENEQFTENPPDRCYFCKRELFGTLREVADNLGIEHIADGAIYDDLSDHRPGLRAAEELEVKSPLLEVELTKDEIRKLSKRLGLSTWSKPSFACLSSRFPYGHEINESRLTRIDRAEAYLRDLNPGQLRARHHDDHTVRIEVAPEDMDLILEKRMEIVEKMKELDYTYIALDLEGYRTGSMNEVLGEEHLNEQRTAE